ncbi:hypothetical protein J2741_000702 [Methanolinea mesophila]|uniref:hypothetical protein n=1 Tax=Methanolinea mesophila TaxID=547055 RepID=UPI001AE2FD2F|nr:hypothetical protein [Methanolinea mesophila]MBP1928155.1 hypothetical protein [Methanolinea mesophila]
MRLAIVMVLGLLVMSVSVAADPVRLWTDNREYTFPAGVEAKIPLHVENNAGGEVTGVIRAVFTEVADGREIGPWTESRSYAFQAGETTIGFPAGTSDTPLVRLVRLNFDYTAGMTRTLSLDEITVRFVVTDQGASPPATGPGVEAVPGVADPTSPAISGPTNQAGGTDPVGAQATQDMESLQRDLQASQEETARQKEALQTRLVQDPAYVALNETLVSGGYSPREPSINPGSDTDGEFTLRFTSPTGAVLLQGTITRGVITSLEASSSSSLPAPSEFTSDTQYRDQMTQLAEQGFTPAGSRIIIAGNELTLSSEYSGKNGERAVLTAVSRNGVVQSVDLQTDSGIIDIPSLIALIGLLAVLAVLLAYHRRRGSGTAHTQEQDPIVPPEKPDPSVTVKEMIADARKLVPEGDLPGAYRKAGYALRHYVSLRFGKGDEITDTEALNLLRTADSPSLPPAARILARCREVGFARGKGSAEEFSGIADEIDLLVGRGQGQNP